MLFIWNLYSQWKDKGRGNNSEIKVYYRFHPSVALSWTASFCFLPIFISCLARIRQLGLCLYAFTVTQRDLYMSNKCLDWCQSWWVFKEQCEPNSLVRIWSVGKEVEIKEMGCLGLLSFLEGNNSRVCNGCNSVPCGWFLMRLYICSLR